MTKFLSHNIYLGAFFSSNVVFLLKKSHFSLSNALRSDSCSGVGLSMRERVKVL